MAEGPDKDLKWLAENTMPHAFRAAVLSADAREVPAGEARSQAEIAEDLQDAQVRRRRSAWRAVMTEFETERRRAGLPEQPAREDGMPPLTTFADFHPYADEAAQVAVQRSEAPERAAWQVAADAGGGRRQAEDVSVTACGSGMTIVEGTAYGLRAYLQQVLANPLMRVGVDPQPRPDPAPQYPPTPRGLAAQRSWVLRLQDTPSGREAARREAAILWDEAGMRPPRPVAPGVLIS